MRASSSSGAISPKQASGCTGQRAAQEDVLRSTAPGHNYCTRVQLEGGGVMRSCSVRIGLLAVLTLLAAIAITGWASAAPATSSITVGHCGHLCVRIDGEDLMPDTFVSINYSLPSGPVALVDFDHPIGADGTYHNEISLVGSCQPSRDITRRITVFASAVAADGSRIEDSVNVMIPFC
jgi:hypothetical protein